MINDSKRPNCKVKVLSGNVAKLGIFAIKDITRDSELVFDYGDPSVPWRKVSSNKNFK